MANFVAPKLGDRIKRLMIPVLSGTHQFAFWRGIRGVIPTKKRRRIVLWAIGLGLIAGAIDLPLPAEDGFRAIRHNLSMRPADGEVLVISLDEKSLNAIGASEPTRSQDAQLLDRLFSMGADRVFFDRVYADATDIHEDRQLIAAFERHRGKVFVGALPRIQQSDGSVADLLPHPVFRSSVEIVSLEGREAPFGLSASFPVTTSILGAERRSLSAELARLSDKNGFYRPDFAIDYATVPTVSYIDALLGDSVRDAVNGRDVIVAPSSHTSNDFHPMPYRWSVKKVPGVYFHVLGAETLKRGFPLDIGWVPPLLFAFLLIFAQSWENKPTKRTQLIGGACLLLFPFAADAVNVSIDVMPAAICFLIGSVRLHRLAQKTYYGGTGLLRIETMHETTVIPDMDVFALKIRNFAIISASLSPPEVEQLQDKALVMLRATNPDAQVAFHKDTFVWMGPQSLLADAQDHLKGLHAIFRTSISIGAHAPDVATSLGLDMNHGATMRERTENAIQSAEDAARAGEVFHISETRIAEDRKWHLQLLSEFENAIANGEVDVAFQPKVSIATLATVGAEALLRWTHPTRGPINPAQIIAVAEAHSRMDKITHFVLNRALSHTRLAIARHPSFKIAINVSALDLHDALFPFVVEQSLAGHRVPATNLVLEITETAQIYDEGAVSLTLAALKKMGVELSIDDFGTGHATLEHLRRIPADEVKIDQSFVSSMETSEESRMLVKTSIEMIHSLGRRAVAEGVESQAVVTMLSEMGCEQAQGYFFSKPIAMRDLIPMLSPEAIAA